MTTRASQPTPVGYSARREGKAYSGVLCRAGAHGLFNFKKQTSSHTRGLAASLLAHLTVFARPRWSGAWVGEGRPRGRARLGPRPRALTCCPPPPGQQPPGPPPLLREEQDPGAHVSALAWHPPPPPPDSGGPLSHAVFPPRRSIPRETSAPLRQLLLALLQRNHRDRMDFGERGPLGTVGSWVPSAPSPAAQAVKSLGLLRESPRAGGGLAGSGT